VDGGMTEPLPPDTIKALEREGADPRLTKSQARFSAVISRCLGVPCHPLTAESVTFIKSFDETMRSVVALSNAELLEE
jgi:hypothetical protein